MDPTNINNTDQNQQNNNIPVTPVLDIKSKNSKHKIIIGLFLFVILLLGIFLFLFSLKAHEVQSQNANITIPVNINKYGQGFLIYQMDGYIWKWDISTNTIGKIISYPNPKDSDDTITWSISPDNQRLLLSHPTKGLIEIDLASQKIRTIDPTGTDGLYSPDNQYFYYIGDKKIISENCIEGTPCWTTDTIIANREGTYKDILPDVGLDNLSPQAWSPDGKYLVYGDANESGYESVSIFNVHSNAVTHLIRMNDNSGTFFSPAWSPDGTSVCSFYGYFYSDPVNPANTIVANSVYVINVATKKVKITKPFSFGSNSLCYWSPNSNLFGIITGDSEISLYNKNADLVNKINLPGSIMMGTADSWKEITWSPDGNYIILNSSKNLYLVNIKTDAYTKILSGVTQTNFSTYWSN
jgi:hypothetical protein